MPQRRKPPQPPDTLARRVAACRARIQQKAVDGYLLTNPVDQYYLTGFPGEDGAALILPHRIILITDGRFIGEARETPWADAIFRTGPMAEALEPVLTRHRIRRLGFQPEAMSVASNVLLARAIRPARMVGIKDLVPGLRLTKDAGEVACIERASRVAESAFKAILRGLKPGMTERQIAADLQHEMIRRGASAASFPIIVAEGPNAAKPHAVPGDRKIKVGSALLIDWGATVDSYRSDLTRVVFIRRIPPRFRKMYASVVEAQEAAIRAIRPGARMCDVDAVARDVLKQAKLDQYFTHGLGHGLGLDIHEAPRLSRNEKDRLAVGMVVTVEPGVYQAGVGGVRIEDDVLVTERGCRVLSRLSKNPDDMVL
jgi:Xaa-Pro aminopeptidase